MREAARIALISTAWCVGLEISLAHQRCDGPFLWSVVCCAVLSSRLCFRGSFPDNSRGNIDGYGLSFHDNLWHFEEFWCVTQVMPQKTSPLDQNTRIRREKHVVSLSKAAVVLARIRRPRFLQRILFFNPNIWRKGACGTNDVAVMAPNVSGGRLWPLKSMTFVVLGRPHDFGTGNIRALTRNSFSAVINQNDISTRQHRIWWQWFW